MNSFPSNSSRGDGTSSYGNTSRLVLPGDTRVPSAFAKYLGKLYMDRRNGEKPSKELLHRAIEIIQTQAPKKNKIPVTFATTPQYEIAANKAACLIGTAKDGAALLRVPIFAICTAGCLGKVFFYVTTMNRKARQETMRYWVHAFAYKNCKTASAVAAHVIDKCESVRAHRQAQFFASTPDAHQASGSMYGSPAASVYASTPQSVLSAGSGSSASDASLHSATGSQLSLPYAGQWHTASRSVSPHHDGRARHTAGMQPHAKPTPSAAWSTPSQPAARAVAPLMMLTPRDNVGFNLSRSGQSGMKWGTTEV
eukprot:m.35785 g.35785  ORF g.35785 m.35785 type:complete len:310 (-) comp14433_c0_seq1:1045-1974(-)